MEDEEYLEELRERILEKLDDLREKIESNESCPEKEQDLDLLSDIIDNLDECLSNWYY